MRQTGSSRLKVVSCTTSLSTLLTGMGHEVRCQVEKVIENSTNFCANFRDLNWIAHGTQNRRDFTSAVPRLLPAHQPRLLGLLPLSGRGLIFHFWLWQLPPRAAVTHVRTYQSLPDRGLILCSRHLSLEKTWKQLLHSWLCTVSTWGLILCSRNLSPEKLSEQLFHSWLCTVSTLQRTDPLFPTSVLREDLRTAVTLVTLHSLYLAEDWSSVPDICPQRRSEKSCYTRDSSQPLPGRGLILCSRHLSSERTGVMQLLHSWLCTASTSQRTDTLFPTSVLREDLKTAVTLVTLHSLYLAEDWSSVPHICPQRRSENSCYTHDSAQPLTCRGLILCSPHLSSGKIWEHLRKLRPPLS